MARKRTPASTLLGENFNPPRNQKVQEARNIELQEARNKEVEEPKNTQGKRGRPRGKVEYRKATFSVSDGHIIALKETVLMLYKQGVSVDQSTLIRAALDFYLPMVAGDEGKAMKTLEAQLKG